MTSSFPTFFRNSSFQEARTCPAPFFIILFFIFLKHCINVNHLLQKYIHQDAQFRYKILPKMHFFVFLHFFMKEVKTGCGQNWKNIQFGEISFLRVISTQMVTNIQKYGDFLRGSLSAPACFLQKVALNKVDCYLINKY